ncbi:unnamed protein product, partial [Adineta steineri]
MVRVGSDIGLNQIVTTSSPNSSSSSSVSASFVTASNTPSAATLSLLSTVQAEVHQQAPLQLVQVDQQAVLQVVQARVHRHQHQQALLQQAVQLARHQQHIYRKMHDDLLTVFIYFYLATTTTTAFSSCNNLRWNQTGEIVAGTTIQGSSANQLRNPSCLYIDNNNTLYICDQNNNRMERC